MSIHIEAKKGDIADIVLLPGDPMRAKYIAEKFLENPICYNKVRGMFGFTGTYNGKKVSVQGTGMGLPSLSIYVNELIKEYDVKKLIRVGSCGALQPKLKLRDVILALSASTNSSMNRRRFGETSYCPTADFDLLMDAFSTAKDKGINAYVGQVISSDSFYDDYNKNIYEKVADYGVLAVEMETSELYTLAARYNVKALSVLTVSDSLVTFEETTSAEREKTFDEMIEIVLDSATE
jgi:purine-nucleoside phosphorylase